VHSRGPAIVAEICRELGATRSARLAGVSRNTMVRWLNAPPGTRVFGLSGRSFGAGRSASLWMGYPSPLPAWDLLSEHLVGDEASYLHTLLVHPGGFILDDLRSGMSLDMLSTVLGLDRVEVLAAGRATGLPATSVRRWVEGVVYPAQWVALDRLCLSVRGCGWLESLLSADLQHISSPIPRGAMACLIEYFTRA